MVCIKPSIAMAALPGRRHTAIELAQKIEANGFSGIYASARGYNLEFSLSLAHSTSEIHFGTSIAPIYFRSPRSYAETVSYIHEVSGGRFRFGIGVSHEAVLKSMGLSGGKPLGDTRSFVEHLQAASDVGPLPPIVLAALRGRMIALAGEIADGLIFANGARSHMRSSFASLPEDKRDSDMFMRGCMTPTVVADDVDAARARAKQVVSHHLVLPAYRAYWREAGFVEDVDLIEAAIRQNDTASLSKTISDRFIADIAIFGTATQVRDQVDAWHDVGINNLILVPSSIAGNQFRAIEEVLAAFSR